MCKIWMGVKKFKLVLYSLIEENNFISSWNYYVMVESEFSGCVIFFICF